MTTLRMMIDRKVNDDFSSRLAAFMRDTHGIAVKTSFNLLSGNLVTTTAAGTKLTKKHYEAIRNFEGGYLAARAALNQK